MKLSDEDAVGANLSDLGAQDVCQYCEYADKDSDGGGSDCPMDFACLSEVLRNHGDLVRLVGQLMPVQLGWVL